MMTLITTTDALKITAIESLLTSAGVACEVFDRAAGSLWSAIIPIRIMVADEDRARAGQVLREAGFVEARDGEWDLRGVS